MTLIERIRGFGILVSVAVFGIGAIAISFVLFPLVRIFLKDKKLRHIAYSKIIEKSWKFLIAFMTFIKVLKVNPEGLDKLKTIKNSIIVATHPSYLDVVVMLSLIPKTTSFVTSRLVENFFMKRIVNSMFLNSAKPLDVIMAEVASMLDEGFNVLIFPSGKRHDASAKPHLKKGAAQIALELKRDIVPVKIVVNDDFLKRNVPFHRGGGKKIAHFAINVLEPIKINDYIEKYPDTIELKKRLTARIFDVLFEN